MRGRIVRSITITFGAMFVPNAGLDTGRASAEPLPVARAFAEPDLAGATAQGVQMSPDGRFVGYLRPAADDPAATILWIMPVVKRGEAPRALIDTRTIDATSPGSAEDVSKMLERRHIAAGNSIDYRWSATSDRLLLSIGGDIFLASIRGGPVLRLTMTDALESDAKLSADARFVSFLRGGTLYIEDVATRTERKVGGDADATVTYGSAEFVAQEEMQRFTGTWWSPDGSRIAYTRVDTGKVALVPRLRIDSTALSLTNDRYPVTGSANAEVRLFVAGPEGGIPVAVDLGGDPDIYLYSVDWSKDGRTLYVQRQSRDQKRLDLLAVDPTSGASRVILTRTSTTWVDLERDFRPLSDGSFLWGAVRDGWRRLFLYRRDGTPIRQVTTGAWRLANPNARAAPDFSPIVAVDEAKGLLYVVASVATPIEQQLYRLSYRHSDTPHPITMGEGWWEATMASNKPTTFVGTYSDPATPPNIALYDVSGKRTAWIARNALDAAHPMARYLDHRPSYGFGAIKAANGDDLFYTLAKPADFDAAKRYPVIVRVYGGPNVQTVRREWRYTSDQLLTQAGYIVFSLDNRGSTNRDEAFEHALAGAIGGVNTADQIAGVRYLQGLPFVDRNRIGMMGWSFGGYLTVRAMTEPGSGIRVGAAGGVPSDFTLYDTHYTERFLGTPQAQGRAYRDSALLPRAGALQGKLLLLQGLSDDNVVISNFTSLSNALQQSGKVFETAVYPGQGHAIRGEKTLAQMWETYLDFFQRRLKTVVEAQ